MRVRIIVLLFLILFGVYSMVTFHKRDPLIPSFDLNVPAPLPKSARILNGPYALGTMPGVPSRIGLDLLRGSASGQLTESSLHFLTNRLPNPSLVTVVDLREESHGFVNGVPICWVLPDSTWTNEGKTVAMIEADEKERLQEILKNGFVILDPETNPLRLIVGQVQTERELVESLGMQYERIPITENHHPADEQVDRLVKLIQTLPEGRWLHGHCHGGRGRATLFAALFDILKNHEHFKVEEILMRQLLLGGTDLMNVPDDFRHDVALERIQFFRTFYTYVKETQGNLSFADWKASKNNVDVHEISRPQM